MSRSWRLAESLKTLLGQVNNEFPHRRKDSDGGIGNAEHAARTSDHNPYIVYDGEGVVRAYDFTHAPETGFDAYAFAETLRLERDTRVRYIISNHRIASGKGGPSPWTWRKYTGSNPHDHHTHVSVTELESEFDGKSKWDLDGMLAQIEAHVDEANNYVTPPPTLRIGSRGALVRVLQTAIGVIIDGYFGPETESALRRFQTKYDLLVDGVCGPQTWRIVQYPSTRAGVTRA